jgi:TPR repeat protein
MYRNGEGADRNYEAAIHWYEKAAEQGHLDACDALAGLYARGGELSTVENEVEPDLTKYAYWVKKAADTGHVGHIYLYGLLLYQGVGVPQNDKEAFLWFERAAKEGYADGQYNLAKCYEMSHGTEKNLELARHWYTQAAANGHINAGDALAMMEED